MRKHTWLLTVMTVCVLVGTGCKPSNENGSTATSGAPANTASEAADRTAPSSPPTAGHPWSRQEIEAWLRGDLGLVEVSLTPAGGDNYTGTGKDEQGTPYTLKVTQSPGHIVCEHQSPARTAPGKFTTGKIEFGK
ncbi:MAG TPA: hypothetical protein VLJ39_13520 [Tepidisphaeraceae bacterium]|nr:hypothetical protein [Tepidisphaeraceae bacterium]